MAAASPTLPSFYKRPLPPGCIAFSSEEGRRVFREALALGTMEGFFALAEQFHTQAEPAFCGLGTLVTVLNALGYARTVAFARNFGFASKLYPYPSLALGTSEVTLMELVSAYGAFPSGGILATPRYYTEIRDRDGNVIEEVKRERREVMRDDVAAVMVSMMQGVVQRGTATSAAPLGTALAGKTGTTDDYTDAWFLGFTPDLVVGVYLGYDKPRHLGRGATGGVLAAPIVRDFMKVALADKPAVPFRVPAGIKLIRIDPKTGMRAAPGDQRVILEAFKPGTAPPDNYAVIGVTDADGRPLGVSPEADRAVRSSGTGGLW